MARIELDKVNLTFRVRQRGRITFKELMIRQLFRPSRNPKVEVHALQDVNLRLNAGDRLGIVGHNGAGKSTLLKLLAGIYPPTSGKRIVEGRISSLFEIALGFELDATGWENIAYRGYLQGETPYSLKEKIQPIAEFTELGQFLNVPVRYYSAGMLVRLAFSIATSIEPQVLLVDEVLSVGDMAFQNKARQRMLEMMAKADVIVMVSHDMVSLARMCDRVVWLDHGKVRQIGPAAEVIGAYTSHMQGTPPQTASEVQQLAAPEAAAPAKHTGPLPQWEATGLVGGYYDVQLSWTPDGACAPWGLYLVFDGPRQVARVCVNRQTVPSGTACEGLNFQSLGTFAIRSGTVRVELTDGIPNCAIANAVRIAPVPEHGPMVIDNQQPGFEQIGADWTCFAGTGGCGNRVSLVAPGDGSQTASWQVEGLSPANYAVRTTWTPYLDRATNAPYHIYDGSTLLSTVRVNQQEAPAGLPVQGVTFQRLGVFPVRSGTLRVVLSNDADGYLIADAVLIAEKAVGDALILRTRQPDAVPAEQTRAA